MIAGASPAELPPARNQGAILHSPRLQLRHLSDQDEAIYLALYTDREQMRYIGEPMAPAVARTAFKQCCRLNRQGSRRYRSWIVLDGEMGRAVGFSVLQASGNEAEVGTFVLPAWRRRGLGAEATHCVAGHALQWPGVEFVRTRHRPENLGGAGLMSKLSFEQEAGVRADGMQYWCLRRKPHELAVQIVP